MNRNFSSFYNEVREEVRTGGIEQFEQYRAKTRRETGVGIGDTDTCDSMPLTEIILVLKKRLRELPQDQRSGAFLAIDTDYSDDEHVVHVFEVGVYAPMTDDELIRSVAIIRYDDYQQDCRFKERAVQEERNRKFEIEKLKELARKYPEVLKGAK